MTTRPRGPMTELQGWLVDWVDLGMAEQGWTQAETAAAVGITWQHLSTILNGKAHGSLPLWDALLTSLGVRERALSAPS